MYLKEEDIGKIGFKRVGTGVLISDKCSFYNPQYIEIGNNVRIDDFCILSCGESGIILGNYIHIGCQSTLIGKGKIILSDFCNISSKVSIYSSNDDYSGQFMTNPMVDPKFTNVVHKDVFLGKHTIIGSNSVILPGVVIGECCSVGALSLVKESIDNGWIVGGVPAKKLKRRYTNLKNLELQMMKSILPECVVDSNREEMMNKIYLDREPKKLKLSVAIPAYKFSEYIEQCINSFQKQETDFDFEIVVRDDFSQDGTDQILERLSKSDPRIKVLDSSDGNLGVWGNIKRILENCSGEYISYLDGDDWIVDRYKLQKQVNFLDKNPDYVMHSAAYKHSHEINEWYFLHSKKEDIILNDILDTNFSGFGRTFRNIPNLIKDWMKNYTFLDWIMNYEILKNGKWKSEKWYSGVYRVYNTSYHVNREFNKEEYKKIMMEKINE